MREGSGRRKGEFACIACWFVFGFFFPEEMEGKARVALVCPYASRAGWCQRRYAGLDGYSMVTLVCPMDWEGGCISPCTHICYPSLVNVTPDGNQEGGFITHIKRTVC